MFIGVVMQQNNPDLEFSGCHGDKRVIKIVVPFLLHDVLIFCVRIFVQEGEETQWSIHVRPSGDVHLGVVNNNRKVLKQLFCSMDTC